VFPEADSTDQAPATAPGFFIAFPTSHTA
jgi:hypothetical protein